MGEQKKLEPDSEYSALDLDNDGVVSDKELAVMEALEKKEKMEAQKKMAWVAMISMLVFLDQNLLSMIYLQNIVYLLNLLEIQNLDNHQALLMFQNTNTSIDQLMFLLMYIL